MEGDDNRRPDWDCSSRREADVPNRKSPFWFVVAAAAAAAVYVSMKRRPSHFERMTHQANSARHDTGHGSSYWYGAWSYGRGMDFERVFFLHRKKPNNAWSTRDRESWEEHMEELERLERIRRVQEAFQRGRGRSGRKYETWQARGSSEDYGQYSGREDWYWGQEDWGKWRAERARARSDPTRLDRTSAHVHHYNVLGLDSARVEPYSDAEIKAAFRAKAFEYHPDRNQHRKEHAESKFREAMASYEALKTDKGSSKGN
eukprot:c24880_g1_i1 orf=90-866(+)